MSNFAYSNCITSDTIVNMGPGPGLALAGIEVGLRIRTKLSKQCLLVEGKLGHALNSYTKNLYNSCKDVIFTCRKCSKLVHNYL